MDLVLLKDGAHGKRGEMVTIDDEKKAHRLINRKWAIQRGAPQGVSVKGIASTVKLGKVQ